MESTGHVGLSVALHPSETASPQLQGAQCQPDQRGHQAVPGSRQLARGCAHSRSSFHATDRLFPQVVSGPHVLAFSRQCRQQSKVRGDRALVQRLERHVSRHASQPPRCRGAAEEGSGPHERCSVWQLARQRSSAAGGGVPRTAGGSAQRGCQGWGGWSRCRQQDKSTAAVRRQSPACPDGSCQGRSGRCELQGGHRKVCGSQRARVRAQRAQRPSRRLPGVHFREMQYISQGPSCVRARSC
mmetsp:Transcript_7202/g.13369  ORF Transcript_7202/g.13369 Transcript_7202/m.13369 type:complete len:242 (-) Transcript_7202:153-878(-)